MSTRTLARPRRHKRAAHKLGNDYMRLFRELPLRPLRSDRDYQAAVAILDRLAVAPEGSLSPGQRDYMETLTLLVEAYDTEHFEIKTKRMTPLETLKYLMDQSGLTAAGLGRLVGSRALVSLILNGHRGLSKAHIGVLANHFKVEPGLLLDEPPGK